MLTKLFKKSKQTKLNKELEKIFLCDIDGTISDFRHHRGPYEETKVLDDTPLPTIHVIKALISSGNRIIYFSGRSEFCYQDTAKWIEKHIGQYPELYMRKSGDSRSDEIIKRGLYDQHILDKYQVIGVFDDRLKVCRMWVELGLWVYNLNQKLIEF